MNELNNLMQNEYDAMSGMNIPMPDIIDEALQTVRDKLTDKEYAKIEEKIVSGCICSERFGFEQGFMRGIVVAKGGAA